MPYPICKLPPAVVKYLEREGILDPNHPPHIHSGFWKVSSALNKKVKQSCIDQLSAWQTAAEKDKGENVQTNHVEVVITGHSLGGALAVSRVVVVRFVGQTMGAM